MSMSDLKKVISKGESQHLEFKTSIRQLKAAFQSICGFLNHKGGMVLMGVKDNGAIVGQHISDATALEISNYIAKIEPHADIDVQRIAVANKKYVIVIKTKDAVSRPYVFDSKPYLRIETSTRAMSQQRYEQLLINRLSSARSWDSEVPGHFSIEDLDSQEIIDTLHESIRKGRTEAKLATDDPKLALSRLKLLKHGKPINAAGVLFCKEAEALFPRCLCRLFVFKGLTKGDIIDSKRVYGNAFVQIHEMEVFLRRHMFIASEFIPGQMARSDKPEYPVKAVREALINAICHRDYTVPGSSISFMMYDDRIEVTSFGLLPQGITVEDLKKDHESIPRNEKLAYIMYKRGYVESAGIGMQEMMEECKRLGSPEPAYFEQGATFVVKFWSNARRSAQKSTIISLTPRQQEILSIMAVLGTCTTPQILAKMKQPPTDRTLRSDLNKLKKMGWVSRKGSRSDTLWIPL